MRTELVSETWMDEEEFFSRARRDPLLRKINKKWSSGSSPIMLIQAGYEYKEEWEKCYWYEYPSSVRCHECEWAKNCPKYVP